MRLLQENIQEKDNQILKSTLRKVQTRLNDGLLSSNFKLICSMYKNIAQQLIFLLNKFQKEIRSYKDIQDSFLQCFKHIVQIIHSTQYSKYGHTLSLFNYIIKKIQKQCSLQIQFNSQTLLSKISTYQKQQYLQKLKSFPITQGQLAYLQTQDFNTDLISISNNQIKIQNLQCVCCSPVFTKGLPITNNNPNFSVVVGLNQKYNLDLTLQRYLCAVGNKGGGVIILGTQTKDNSLWPIGIKFKDLAHIQQKTNEIYKTISYISPSFYYTVQRIVVQSNYLQKDGISDEFMRFCFRILVLPIDQVSKYYVQIYNKGFHSLFDAFQLDPKNKIQKIVAKLTNDTSTPTTFYTIIHEQFYRKNKLRRAGQNTIKSNHFPIRCVKPSMQYSKKFYQYVKNNQMINNNLTTEAYNDQGDQPIFKYAYTSILAVGSTKKDRYIKQLSNQMKAKKLLFQIQKPFQNSFKEGTRSIWMLSHHDRHDIIKSIIKNCDTPGNITFIPLYKTLQIDKHKLTPQKQSQISIQFKNRYPQGYLKHELQKFQQGGYITHPILLQFNSYLHAIYAYLIFQTFQLRPYFVKDNTMYKKKPKIKSG